MQEKPEHRSHVVVHEWIILLKITPAKITCETGKHPYQTQH